MPGVWAQAGSLWTVETNLSHLVHAPWRFDGWLD
jgi:hypothetical protein